MRSNPWRRAALSLVCSCTVLFALPRPASADTDREVAKLRAELEQANAVREQDRKTMEEQGKRLEQALDRIESLEDARAPEAASARTPGVSAAALEGPRPRLDIYGFIQTDGIYDVNQMDPSWAATLRPSKIPVNCPGDAGCGKNGETILSARQSRLGFRGFMPTAWGEVKTIFEFDLFAVGGNAGEHNFRLRQAWGELGQVGAGQTWSVFMDPDVFPNTIDYWGPPGMVFIRNPQFRWTPISTDDGFSVALALESPSSALDRGKIDEVAPNLDVDARSQYPDGTFHLRYGGDWGHVQAAAVLRGIGYDTPSEPGNDPSGTVLGWGLNLSSVIQTIGRDQLLLQVVYGNGIAAYMNDGGIDLAPSSGFNARAVPLLGWLAYYNRWWDERWSSSIGYSETRQFTTGGQTGDSFETGQYGSVNLLFHPVPGVMMGGEYLWGKRVNEDGSNHDDNRLQFSIKYDFGATLVSTGE